MAPGDKTKTQFYADDRVFWVVQSGQMKVTIEGQEPFVASKGFLVQVPHRNVYSMETVGDKPSLRFEVTILRIGKRAAKVRTTPCPMLDREVTPALRTQDASARQR